ncbi:hypothetical protein D9619_013111 [Psilocybe cf. subviscida]|uniref:DJ-1/PfpI domain-containing protein n=1 Tax=Psilocybe cf. subviscida TaxID=2480587 RepID=A0A8H5AZR6_9AGAR|nr:hypothetical protein D9619_013111 [Psilocybe cf. subviscida]
MAPLISLPASAKPVNDVPLRYGAIVYPGFQALDLFGPLDALNTLSLSYPLSLSVLAESLEPVSTKPPGTLGNQEADFGQTIVPTHTFADAPPIDVLIVPGGFGVRIPENVAAAIAYIAKVYPTLRYVVTVCTGSILVAQAGVLDGRAATTNKRSFVNMTALRSQVNWVPHARWVVDGNIWSSSGVSAGLDIIFAFMSEMYGEEVADTISDILEYERHKDAAWDPYAEKYGL